MASEKRRAAEGQAFREAMSSGNAGFKPPAVSSSVRVSGKVVQKLNFTRASTYKPPHTVCVHDPKDNRIRCFYGPDRIGRGCNLAVGSDNAIRVVLRLAWGLHVRANPTEVCPWDFGEIADL